MRATTRPERIALLSMFFRLYPEDVLALFAALPYARYVEHRGQQSYVFIPGTRDDRVLLVAHVDTVFKAPPKRVEWLGSIAQSPGYGSEGLGADDRAGCAMLWQFRDSGHSLLLVDGEESGCLGSSMAAEEMTEILSDHQFVLEIDRRGDEEMVFYDCATREFEEWLVEQSGNWEVGIGSFTDISVICPTVGLCGANLAAGYLYQHTGNEILVLDAWERTETFLDRLLLNTPELPRFPLPVRQKTSKFGPYGLSAYGWDAEHGEYAKGSGGTGGGYVEYYQVGNDWIDEFELLQMREHYEKGEVDIVEWNEYYADAYAEYLEKEETAELMASGEYTVEVEVETGASDDLPWWEVSAAKRKASHALTDAEWEAMTNEEWEAFARKFVNDEEEEEPQELLDTPRGPRLLTAGERKKSRSKARRERRRRAKAQAIQAQADAEAENQKVETLAQVRAIIATS